MIIPVTHRTATEEPALSSKSVDARSRHSLSTDFGVSLIKNDIPTATTTASSIHPTRGIKEGMSCTGLKTYPTQNAAMTFAYQGTRGSRQMRTAT